MKSRIKFVIWVYLIVLAGYLAFTGLSSLRKSLPYNYYRKMEKFSFNRISYFMLYGDLETVLEKNWLLMNTYICTSSHMKVKTDSLNRVSNIMQSYLNTLPEMNQDIPQYEIVRIERISSADIMNSPAYYNRNISNNVVKENGQGADEKTICLIYLSNGEIIEAGLDDNGHWLGTREGERVLKTTSLEISPCYSGSENELNSYSTQTTTSYKPLY